MIPGDPEYDEPWRAWQDLPEGGLPRPAAGSFLPDPWGPRSPGYSCKHCGAVLVKCRRWPGHMHAHNKSVFCRYALTGWFRLATVSTRVWDEP